MSAPLKILIVDDHPATRDGLRIAIVAQPDLQIAGEAATWQTAFRLAQELRPDVMVLDLNLPDGNGWTLIEQLKSTKNLPNTLVLSVCDEQIYARRLLRAGARGYLMKDEPLAIILQAIRDIARGELVASPALTKQLLQEAIGWAEEPIKTESTSSIGELSDRELQIFALLGNGDRNKEVAAHLGLSEKTVATYKVRLLKKLGVRTTPQLMERYRTWGTTAPDSHPHAKGIHD
jgi:DNA-binding NarL/FixJ family response regulator